MDELGGDCAFDFLARRRGAIDERASDFPAGQQSLPEQPIHRRHDRRVRDRGTETIARVPHRDFLLLPHERHDVTLERAEAPLEKVARRFEAPEEEPHGEVENITRAGWAGSAGWVCA